MGMLQYVRFFIGGQNDSSHLKSLLWRGEGFLEWVCGNCRANPHPNIVGWSLPVVLDVDFGYWHSRYLEPNDATSDANISSQLPNSGVAGEVKTLLRGDRKSTRLNSSHLGISYAVFCL